MTSLNHERHIGMSLFVKAVGLADSSYPG